MDANDICLGLASTMRRIEFTGESLRRTRGGQLKTA